MGEGPAPRENINDPVWDEPRDREGFRARRSRIGRRLGTERLGVSLWEIPPGEAAYPYHLHLAEEELVVVLAGSPWLRTPDGWRRLAEGEVVGFPRGEAGAHQIVNRDDAVVRLLAISTNGEPDIVVQPDSGKVGPAERRPDGSGLWAWFRMDDRADYWDGEEPPAPPED